MSDFRKSPDDHKYQYYCILLPKAVAEVSKTGNLWERFVVMHGCQSEPNEGWTGG